MAYEAETLDELQQQILFEDLSDNPLLPYSKLASKNKALNTTKKTIIGAINELLDKINKLESTVVKSLDQQNDVLGDFINDPTLVEKMNIDVGNSIIESIINLDKECTVFAAIFEVIEDNTENFQLNFENDNAVSIENLIINGVEYDSSAYTYDVSTKKVHWVNTKANGGFNIVSGDKVVVKYRFRS